MSARPDLDAAWEAAQRRRRPALVGPREDEPGARVIDLTPRVARLPSPEPIPVERSRPDLDAAWEAAQRRRRTAAEPALPEAERARLVEALPAAPQKVGVPPSPRRQAAGYAAALEAGGLSRAQAATRALTRGVRPAPAPSVPAAQRPSLRAFGEEYLGRVERLGAEPEEPETRGAVLRNVPRAVVNIPIALATLPVTAPLRVALAGGGVAGLKAAGREVAGTLPFGPEVMAALDAAPGERLEAALRQYAAGGGLSPVFAVLAGAGLKRGVGPRPAVEAILDRAAKETGAGLARETAGPAAMGFPAPPPPPARPPPLPPAPLRLLSPEEQAAGAWWRRGMEAERPAALPVAREAAAPPPPAPATVAPPSEVPPVARAAPAPAGAAPRPVSEPVTAPAGARPLTQPVRAAGERGAVAVPSPEAVQAAMRRLEEGLQSAKRAVRSPVYSIARSKMLTDEGLSELAARYRRDAPGLGDERAEGWTNLARSLSDARLIPVDKQASVYDTMYRLRTLARSDERAFDYEYARAMRDPVFARMEAVRELVYGFKGKRGQIDPWNEDFAPGLPRDPYYVPASLARDAPEVAFMQRGERARLSETAGGIEARPARRARVREVAFVKAFKGAGGRYADLFAQMDRDLHQRFVVAGENAFIREALKTGRPLARGDAPAEGMAIHTLRPWEVAQAEFLGLLPPGLRAAEAARWEVKPSVRMALDEYRQRVSPSAPAWRAVHTISGWFNRVGVSWDMFGIGLNARQWILASSTARPWETRAILARAVLRGIANLPANHGPRVLREFMRDTRLRRWARVKPDEARGLMELARRMPVEAGGRTPEEFGRFNRWNPLHLYTEGANLTQYAPEGVQQLGRAMMEQALLRPGSLQRILVRGGLSADGAKIVDRVTGGDIFDRRNPKQMAALDREVETVFWGTALRDASRSAQNFLRGTVRFPSARAAALRAIENTVRNPQRLVRMLVGFELMNFMLTAPDKDGPRFSWDNEPGNELVLETWMRGDDGRPYVLPALGAVGMLLRALGARQAIGGLRSDDPDGWRIVEDWATSIPENVMREAIYSISPLIGAAWIATTGRSLTGRDVTGGRGTAGGVQAAAREIGAMAAPPLAPYLSPRPGETGGERAVRTGFELGGLRPPYVPERGPFEVERAAQARAEEAYVRDVAATLLTVEQAVALAQKRGIVPTEEFVRRLALAQARAQMPRAVRRVTSLERRPGLAPYFEP